MHYTNAFMLESLRIVSFAFFSVPHSATTDIKLGDYVIPKGTGIFPSLISVMYDPKHFPGPHYLKPERFLDDNGKYKHVLDFTTSNQFYLHLYFRCHLCHHDTFQFHCIWYDVRTTREMIKVLRKSFGCVLFLFAIITIYTLKMSRDYNHGKYSIHFNLYRIK
mgnify:CR=1 FL=1